MHPTYLFSEIKPLVRVLDFSSITIFEELIEEEKDLYDSVELRAIYRFIQLKNKGLIRNEVKLDFLLSFN